MYSFPPVPSNPNTFESKNLTRHTTFFGCNSATSAPLVVYIANGGPPLGQAPLTNVSTFTDTFTPAQIEGVLDQAFDIATQGIPVLNVHGAVVKDPQFAVCLACAVADRPRARMGVKRSGVCESCLTRYCFS